MTRQSPQGGVTADRRAGGDNPPAAHAGPVTAAPEVEKRPLTFEEVDKTPDSREKMDKPSRPRSEDFLNDAVGTPYYILNGNQHGWTYPGPRGRTFAVTRFYWHQKVAIDFPRTMLDVEDVKAKAAILKALGVAYVAILPNESLTIETVQARIAEARKAIEAAAKPEGGS